MDKLEIVAAMMADLERELQRQKAANEQASSGATDSEAKAESKWDTQGLEASYLARGYAQQFETLTAQVETVRNFEPREFSGRAIGIGALIDCEVNGYRSLFFLFHCCGGKELMIDGKEVTVITLESPVGSALVNKRQGGTYALPSGVSGSIVDVT